MRHQEINYIDRPTCTVISRPIYFRLDTFEVNSGFPSSRINLSPFTKDFRGGEQ